MNARDLIRMQLAMPKKPAGEEVTLEGVNPPITLSDALAKPLISLKQYGKAEQASTPTPSSPVPIFANNGQLAWAETDLPIGYRRLTGIGFDGSVYYKITGFHLMGSDSVQISFSVTAACNVFGCYSTTQAQDNYSLYMSTAAGAKYLRYNGGTYASRITSSQYGEQIDLLVTPYGSYGMPNQDDTWDAKEFESTEDMCIGSTSPNATSSKLTGEIYGDFIVQDRFWGIPCMRMSDNVIGYYDVYSETFYAPAAGTPTSLGFDDMNRYLGLFGTREEIYIGYNTYAADDLYGIGDVADSHDIVSGIAVHRFGMMMLTGEETMQYSSSTGRMTLYGVTGSKSSGQVLCTHYRGVQTAAASLANGDVRINSDQAVFMDNSLASKSMWQTWLAQQYAAGDPVILLYELATPREDEYSQQTITLSEGENTISVYSPNVEDIEFDVTYLMASS